MYPMKNMLELLRQSFPDFTVISTLDEPGRNALLLKEADQLLRSPHARRREAFLARFGKEEVNPLYHDECMKELSPLEQTEIAFYKELKDLLSELISRNMHSIPACICSVMNGKETDFCIDNDELTDFCYTSGYTHIAFYLLLNLAEQMLREQTGVNPVVQDKLAHNLDACWKLSTQEDRIRQTIDEMTELLYKLTDHLEIGRRLGLSPKELAVYDAIRGFLTEAFDPRTLDMALDLTAWLRTKPLHLSQELSGKLSDYAEKHRVALSDETLTLNYILHEIEGVAWEKQKTRK